MIDSGIRNERFLDKNFLKLIEILYNSSGLNVSKVVYNDDVVAISLIFKQKDSYFFWVDLYNDLKMINLYHNIKFIKSITKLSAATFNFGRGVYNYKLQNFAPELKILVDFSTFENKCTMYIFLLKNSLRRIIKVTIDLFKN